MTTKTHILLIFLSFSMLLGNMAVGQNYPDSKYQYKVYEVDGMKVGEIELTEVEITDKRPSKARIRRGQRRLQRYTRLEWHVHKVYPYALKVSEIMEEIDYELKNLPEGEKKKKYIKKKEKSLFGKYEKDLRKMTRTQGRILIKLVYRQTGISMYQIIREMKSGATAVFWQSIGLIFGLNLKVEYDADEEENWMIERIVTKLENGGYNIVYGSPNYVLK